MHARLNIALKMAALTAAVLLIYAARLAYSPSHLHYDEVFFGLEGHAIATTGRDLNGRFMPLYFQLALSFNWYQPMAVYLTALCLKVLPFSEGTIRFPAVIVAVLDVMLMFAIARRLFTHEWLAWIAAAMLALTPAHFIHSRLAMDYVYPLPFIMGWLLCLIVFLEGDQLWVLLAGTMCLGFGLYSYIASVGMMPIYLLLTGLALALTKKKPAAYAVAAAGMVLPMLLGIVFLLQYPNVYTDMLRKYGRTQTQLNPFQQLRELMNYTGLTERVTVYWDFFNPAYLFFSGGSNLTNSTSRAGVFLLPLAVFLAIGLCRAVRSPRTRLNAIVVLGFLTAPLAALSIAEPYAIDRELGLLPFAILLATGGVDYLWSAPVRTSLSAIYLPVSAAGLVIGVGYAVATLVTRGYITTSTWLLMLVSIIVFVIGAATDGTRRWQFVTICLLLLLPAQFTYFYRDYFTGYRARSAGWFGGNIRGGLEEIIAMDGQERLPAIYLSTDIPYIESYWKLYLIKHRREDLEARTVYFNTESLNVQTVPGKSLMLVNVVDNAAEEALVSQGALRMARTITDPSDFSGLGVGTLASFIIYER